MLARLTASVLVVLVLLPFTAPFPVTRLTDFLGGADDESLTTALFASVEDVTDAATATVPSRHKKAKIRLLAVTSPGGTDILVPRVHSFCGPAGVEPPGSTPVDALRVLRI